MPRPGKSPAPPWATPALWAALLAASGAVLGGQAAPAQPVPAQPVPAPGPPGQTAPAPKAPAPSQSADDRNGDKDDDRPLDARLYAQGMDAARAGRRDEARRLLRRVADEFPDSSWAPPALLKLAEFAYPVTAWSQIGAASSQNVQQATELLQRLTQKYRSSREAPRALVRLGYLGFEPAGPRLNLDEACGRFATAAQMYPDSDAADDAGFGSGMCDLLRGRAARAASTFGRLLEEHPASPLADEALYREGIALSLLDDPAEAMILLERVRSRVPESKFAPEALERLTLLHRMRILPALLRGAPVPAAGKAAAGIDWTALYRIDPDYGPAAGAAQAIRGISDLSIDPQGLVVAASPRTPAVFRLDAHGKIQERIDHPGPDHVAAAEGLAVYIAGRDQIAVNQRNWSGPSLLGPEGRPLSDFGPIAVDALGTVHLIDRHENAVLVYDRARRLVAAVRPPPGHEGRFVDVATGAEGAIFALDARARAVVVISQAQETRRIDLGGLGVADPASLAVDALGDLFVLDGGTGWIFVGDPDGRRVTVVRPPASVGDRLGEISSLAIDPQGRLYLAGRKTGVVVRLQ
jgi:TolA-binding protein